MLQAMDKAEIREIGEELFGSWGWRTRMAEFLHVNVSSVRRWVAGDVPIPGPVEVALGYAIREHRRAQGGP